MALGRSGIGTGTYWKCQCLVVCKEQFLKKHTTHENMRMPRRRRENEKIQISQLSNYELNRFRQVMLSLNHKIRYMNQPDTFIHMTN